jgi:hypothetical protein
MLELAATTTFITSGQVQEILSEAKLLIGKLFICDFDLSQLALTLTAIIPRKSPMPI